MDPSPPKYEEADANGLKLKVNDMGWTLPATAALTPLLELNEPKIGYTITKEETKREYGPFNFHVKDLSNGASVFEGEVSYDQTATITGTGSDDPFTIEIKQVKPPVKVKNTCTFDVVKGVVSMATIILDIAKREIVINSSASGRNYVANEIELSQNCSFTIKKNGETATRIEFPEGKDYEPFECTLEFYPTAEPITEMEKELFLSLAVICMLVRNGPIFTKLEHTFWAGLGYTVAIGLIVGVVFGLYYVFDYLTTDCNTPGYRCGNIYHN